MRSFAVVTKYFNEDFNVEYSSYIVLCDKTDIWEVRLEEWRNRGNDKAFTFGKFIFENQSFIMYSNQARKIRNLLGLDFANNMLIEGDSMTVMISETDASYVLDVLRNELKRCE